MTLTWTLTASMGATSYQVRVEVRVRVGMVGERVGFSLLERGPAP